VFWVADQSHTLLTVARPCTDLWPPACRSNVVGSGSESQIFEGSAICDGSRQAPGRSLQGLPAESDRYRIALEIAIMPWPDFDMISTCGDSYADPDCDTIPQSGWDSAISQESRGVMRNRGGIDWRKIRAAAVIAAGGRDPDRRFRSKQFLDLGGTPMLVRTVDSLLVLEPVVQVIIALPAEYIPAARQLFARKSWRVPVDCIPEGSTARNRWFRVPPHWSLT